MPDAYIINENRGVVTTAMTDLLKFSFYTLISCHAVELHRRSRANLETCA
jgi:hypothetical protein